MGEIAPRLASWIVAEGASGGRLELRYKSTELLSVTIPSTVPDGWADRVAADFVEAATLDAGQLGNGTHRYTVQVRRELDTEHAAASFPVPVTIARDKSLTGFEYEQPDPANLMAQLMRHNENRERTAAMLFSAALDTQQKLVVKLASEVERLTERQLTNARAVEELLSMRAERELEAKKAEAQMQLMADAARDLKPLAGAVIGRLLGPKAPTGLAPDDPQRQALASLLSSLSAEQQQQITAVLSPAQQVALAELVSAIH